MAKLPNSAGERTDGEWLSPSQNAGLAQLVEYLFCTQDVAGSNPVSGSTAWSSVETESKGIKMLNRKGNVMISKLRCEEGCI